ncbi:MAG: class I SAM-dependent methyltransferase [Pseudomonadales bacterium]
MHGETDAGKRPHLAPGPAARWWAEFNRDGDDIGYFHEAILRHGEPALDAGCGTGRLLIPIRRAGVDIDGSDASSDMLDWCRGLAQAEGLEAGLYPQAMHQLALPRRYRTIIIYVRSLDSAAPVLPISKGSNGLHAHLEPGGTLVMDHYLPNLESGDWKAWVREPQLPRDWLARGDRRRAADGTELEIRTRQAAPDPLSRPRRWRSASRTTARTARVSTSKPTPSTSARTSAKRSS